MTDEMTKEEAIKNIRFVLSALDENSQIAEAYRMAIKALEQEPCEDKYIKVPKKALKYRTAGMVAYNAEWLKNNFDIERVAICGAREPSGDLISREATLEPYKILDDTDTICVAVIRANILQQPPVNPTKTGHWIWCVGSHKCSNCEEYTCFSHKELLRYCPNCGAWMVEPKESEEV